MMSSHTCVDGRYRRGRRKAAGDGRIRAYQRSFYTIISIGKVIENAGAVTTDKRSCFIVQTIIRVVETMAAGRNGKAVTGPVADGRHHIVADGGRCYRKTSGDGSVRTIVVYGYAIIAQRYAVEDTCVIASDHYTGGIDEAIQRHRHAVAVDDDAESGAGNVRWNDHIRQYRYRRFSMKAGSDGSIAAIIMCGDAIRAIREISENAGVVTHNEIIVAIV